jgi:hypothetical protein
VSEWLGVDHRFLELIAAVVLLSVLIIWDSLE